MCPLLNRYEDSDIIHKRGREIGCIDSRDQVLQNIKVQQKMVKHLKEKIDQIKSDKNFNLVDGVGFASAMGIIVPEVLRMLFDVSAGIEAVGASMAGYSNGMPQTVGPSHFGTGKKLLGIASFKNFGI